MSVDHRYALAAICVREALIVFTCTGTQIMNTESKQWSTAASVLINVERLSRVEFYDSHLWVFDSYEYYDSNCTKYHLDTLLSSCEPPIFKQVPPAQALPNQIKIPSYGASFHQTMSSNGTLIGEFYFDEDCHCWVDLPTRVISKYNPAGDSWETVGLLKKRREAVMVALPDNRFMTIGCCTDRVLFFTID